MSDPDFVAETLDWCNERRAEQSLEPLDKLPKGYKTDPYSCPCGVATNLYVGSFKATELNADGSWEYPNRTHVLPDAVADFVRAFDDGKLPQYEVE